MMKRKQIATFGMLTTLLVGTMWAEESRIPEGVPHLDHVFVIMMENHGYNQIVNNPFAPYTNQLVKSANTANNYFAIAHPSLTNYLEIVGGSNFGVHSDNNPDWHNSLCMTNLASGTVNTDNPPSQSVCPIWGSGTDTPTSVLDTTNETQGLPGEINIDGVRSIPAAQTVGKTIGDQLVDWGKSWKSYQESLSPAGADGVNYSDGFFTDTSKIPVPVWEKQSLIKLYAAKHNPFVYFRSVQEGDDPRNSLNNVVGFEGPHGLYDDLNSGDLPTLSFIAPNQCNDQHGRGNAGPACDFDPNDAGSQAGLNPASIYLGDLTLRTLVSAIHRSLAWEEGRSAIAIVWDENDYSLKPTTNHVLVIVDTNYGVHGVQSSKFYTHFSLLKTLEAGFELPCLNHACDASVHVMSDLFGGRYCARQPLMGGPAPAAPGLQCARCSDKPPDNFRWVLDIL